MDERERPAYPFKDDRIFRNEAVKFIASVVDPDSAMAAAQKRVREQIEYGIRCGELQVKRMGGKRHPREKMSAIELFTWAARQKGWSRLYQVTGIPIPSISSEAELSFRFSLTADGGPIPVDPTEVVSLISNLRAQLFHAKDEIERLWQENAALQTELKICREKKLKRSQTNSKSAQKPRKG